MTEVLRYAAFSEHSEGGNPAGVVLDASGLDAVAMRAIAAEVGYSETAFVTGAREDGSLDVRYFSPLAEVPFCGHATIATGVAWAQRHGPGRLALHTPAGAVALEVRAQDGPAAPPVATLTSVAPHTEPAEEQDVEAALRALGWTVAELDRSLPVRVAFAGARHLVLAAATPERLERLDYDFEALGELMGRRDWTTVALVHREGPAAFRARNPFPPGGVVEDPATGAAAAALGGYLRELGLVAPPAQITIRQGAEMGRPSTLLVAIPAEPGSGIRVSGSAVPIPQGASSGRVRPSA